MDRRIFLRVLGSGASALLVAPACAARAPGEADAPPEDAGDASAGSAGDSGASGSGASGNGGGGGAGGATLDGAPADASDAGDAGPGCLEPSADAGSCVAAPPGRSVGVPCDFAAFRIHPAPHEDLFQAALIGRDASGYYARSAVCTHMGCNLAQPEAVIALGLACPCHGSEFDHYGHVLSGPAPEDLRSVALALGCDGTLYVDLDTNVDPSLRLKL